LENAGGLEVTVISRDTCRRNTLKDVANMLRVLSNISMNFLA
jgi:hypothetical protein